jgi:hypothetical protein
MVAASSRLADEERVTLAPQHYTAAPLERAGQERAILLQVGTVVVP